MQSLNSEANKLFNYLIAVCEEDQSTAQLKGAVVQYMDKNWFVNIFFRCMCL